MSNSEKQESILNLNTLILQTILSILIVIGIVFGLAFFFREELLGYSTIFIKIFGYFGLFFGMVLSDSLPAFIPPDAFLMLAVSGGMSPMITIVSMSLGSILGGSLAYWIGLRLIPRFHLGRKLVLHYEDKLLPYIRKYGFWAVVISALTPIPYSWMAYTVGTFKMPFHLFLFGSLFRILRMSVYFFAMYLGWISGV
ncbi:MAG: VTT domain-containing protein [Leptospira sp.]|nr:VTT domain-containing protein [Leptospira sp.]